MSTNTNKKTLGDVCKIKVKFYLRITTVLCLLAFFLYCIYILMLFLFSCYFKLGWSFVFLSVYLTAISRCFLCFIYSHYTLFVYLCLTLSETCKKSWSSTWSLFRVPRCFGEAALLCFAPLSWKMLQAKQKCHVYVSLG